MVTYDKSMALRGAAPGLKDLCLPRHIRQHRSRRGKHRPHEADVPGRRQLSQQNP